MEKGRLYICPTPIGNLEDITLRTLRILEEVDLIVAEDTRHSIKLLNHYKIKKPLESYHKFNQKEKGPELIYKLKEGKNIGLISDAGMPGISDPGQDLISLAIKEDIRIEVLPGATASITALVLSGLDTEKFAFEGFLPSKKRERQKRLEEIRGEKRSLIFYESPHRLRDCLKDMEKELGDRRISVSKEITKIYEDTFRGSISGAREKYENEEVRGEFVLVIEGNKEKEIKEEIDIKKELQKRIDGGMSKKDAIKEVAQEFKLGKNKVYKKSLEI